MSKFPEASDRADNLVSRSCRPEQYLLAPRGGLTHVDSDRPHGYARPACEPLSDMATQLAYVKACTGSNGLGTFGHIGWS